MKRAMLAASILIPALASADEIRLKGGGRITGSIVERTDTMLVIETAPGRIGVPLARVESVVESESAMAVFRRRAAALRANDVAGWLALAEWAGERELQTQAREAYERVLASDPSNAAAQRGLGNVLFEGRWMSSDDAQRARGLVSFEGGWVTPAEREARAREQRDEEAARGARAEAEQRVREAEARAREAEAQARRAEAEAAAAEDQGQGVPLWIGGGGAVLLPGHGCGDRCDGSANGHGGNHAPPPPRSEPRVERRPKRDGLAGSSSQRRPPARARKPPGSVAAR